jgi:glycosyltransferase involved in cell wall biosynthesis
VIITPCYASKDEIVTSYPETKEKVSVVYEGISLKQQPDSMVQKVKQQFLLNRPYFLFVGTLEKKKNTVLLARGFDRLIEKYNLDVDLVFAGKADMHYPEVRQQTLDIKNKSRLIFTGYLTDDQLAALYQGAHAYANASTNEGFGLPGVEAMQFGLPLVVSNTPVFNEVYDDAAVYFDPTNPDDIAEKLYLLATDKKFFESKQRAARSRSQYFSWDKAAAETLAILKNAGTGYQEIKIQKELEIETT